MRKKEKKGEKREEWCKKMNFSQNFVKRQGLP